MIKSSAHSRCPLVLSWRGATQKLIDGSPLRADQLSAISPAEIGQIRLKVGLELVPLGDLFQIRTSSERQDDPWVRIEGDLRGVSGIGHAQASGRLELDADVGPRLGERMTGGRIVLMGHADVRAGQAMRDGTLEIRGSAGDDLAAPDPGQTRGMRGGVISVRDHVGSRAGLAMRRGMIVVGGHLGEMAGFGMIAGSILGFGTVGPGIASSMKRGTIALFSEQASFTPGLGFAASGHLRPVAIELGLRVIERLGWPETILSSARSGPRLIRYNGDTMAAGLGEVYVRENHA